MTPNVNQLIEHASHEGIGWWGAAAMIIAALSTGWFVKWMVRKFEEVMEDLKASHAQQTEILVGVVVDNSKAINSFVSQIERHTTELHEMRVTVSKCHGPAKETRSDATPHD